MDQVQEILMENYKKLPKDVQNAIVSLDLRGILQEISKKHSLHIDQMGALETETALVMFGIQHPDTYVRNLQENLRLPQALAEAIAIDANDKIFKTIRNSLIKMHSDQEASEQEDIKKQQEEENAAQTEIQREQILKEIEAPQKADEKLLPSPAKNPTVGEVRNEFKLSVKPEGSPQLPATPIEKTSLPEELNMPEENISPMRDLMPEKKIEPSSQPSNPPVTQTETPPVLEETKNKNSFFVNQIDREEKPQTEAPVIAKKIGPIHEEKLQNPTKTIFERVKMDNIKKPEAPTQTVNKSYGGGDPYREAPTA